MRDFVEIFDPQGVLAVNPCQFSKDFPLPKNDGHFEFSPKMEKRKFREIKKHLSRNWCEIERFNKIFGPQGI